MLTILYLRDVPDDKIEPKWVSVNTTDKFDLTPGYGEKKEYCRIRWQFGNEIKTYYKKGNVIEITKIINEALKNHIT